MLSWNDIIKLQISYAIGLAKPLSVTVFSYGTSSLSEKELLHVVEENFDLRPGVIIKYEYFILPYIYLTLQMNIFQVKTVFSAKTYKHLLGITWLTIFMTLDPIGFQITATQTSNLRKNGWKWSFWSRRVPVGEAAEIGHPEKYRWTSGKRNGWFNKTLKCWFESGSLILKFYRENTAPDDNLN